MTSRRTHSRDDPGPDGHIIEQAQIPVTTGFVGDFIRYYALLADLATTTSKLALDGTAARIGDI